MVAPTGRLFTPVVFTDAGLLRALVVDANGNLKVADGSLATQLGTLVFDEDGKLKVTEPPHSLFDLSNVTQVLANGNAINGTTVIYTVPGGKTFYLTYLAFSCFNTAAGVQVGSLRIQLVPPTVAFTISIPAFSASTLGSSSPVTPPIQIPAGGIIDIVSGSVNARVDAAIHGYTI